MSDDNKWNQPARPPAPLFTGKKEKDFVKQINDEIIERVVGQTILYYPVSLEHTAYNEVYGEAIEKSFLSPIRVHAFVKFESQDTTTTGLGVDRVEKITVNFHKRRLTEDQNLADRYYEILTLTEPRWLFGQAESSFEIAATCVRAREGLFNGK